MLSIIGLWEFINKDKQMIWEAWDMIIEPLSLSGAERTQS